MLARQLWLFGGARDEQQRTSIVPPRTPRHVAQRRSEALHEVPPALRGELRTLMQFSRIKAPPPSRLAEACEALVAWAVDAGCPKIGVHFAEAAAAASPSHAYANFLAGRTNRIAGDDWRAEVFYSRAIRFAQRQLVWDVYVRANLGFGRLLAEQGKFGRAAGHYSTAAWAARDQGHPWLAAQTYHDLLVLYYEQGDYETAREYAQLALEQYPHHNERFPILIHDYGFLLVCMGRFANAAPLVEPLMKMPLRPHDQVLVAGTYARIMGALQQEEEYADAENRVLQLAPHYDLHAPFAFVNLGFGAHAMGLWDLAGEYARRAVELAAEKNRKYDLKMARVLQRLIRSKTPAIEPAPPLQGEPAAKLFKMTSVIAKELSSWRGETWTRKEGQAGAWAMGPI